MDIIIVKEEHKASFAHLIPSHLVPLLENPDVFTLGLLEQMEDGYHPIGVLVAQMEEYNSEILWIYVRPEVRGKGAGTKLVRTLIRLLEEEGQAGTLLAFLEQDDPEIFFFLLCGFNLIPAHEGSLFETTVSALAEGKLGKQTAPANVIPFSQVPEICLKDFNAMAQVKQLTSQMVSFPLQPEDYLPCSMAMLEKNEVTGLLLFSQDGEGISLLYHYVLDKDVRKIAALTCAGIAAMKQMYPPQTRVQLASMDTLSQIIANTCAIPAEKSGLIALTYEIEGGMNS